ncbi:hypothetical protein [Neisseria gonorrhoeae]|uniref:hypothetical protein n=1 Tax=Neisseria gonorrhoeae TaxID=485 RepID=UPI0018CD3C0C|nr:hypothetical protein [Neisseria gonorrhoeae]MBG9975666.1 hypothetical protein [Neisseria gonorrhoeae]MCF2988040.1 hypothetical protein [Neisseria gonorrhoeae]MCH8705155.1 hypothetical protein [Neisseria gonorrhoeae]MCH8715460.1 hypothetical protein [Neisseria gonorrhoeae]MCH8722793.1 hypothetical protein [Neisseria gonorrhoeae]
MIENQIDKEITQASCEGRFILKQENGKRFLYLNLPEGSDELNTIWQTDEYDFTVSDLEVSIDVESLHTAVRLLNENQGILHGISTKCSAYSFGFEGKLRYERLDVKPFPIKSFSYYLEFYNDWTGTLYELDLSAFLDEFFGECDPESKLDACLK